MLSRKLWRALHIPPVTEPLYKRTVHAGRLPTPPFTDAIETIASLLVLPIIFFTGAVHGIGWAISISCVIANEQRRDTYDVLGLLPGGRLGATWAFCTACLHRYRKFINLTSGNALMGRIIVIGMCLLGVSPVFIMRDGALVALFYVISALGVIIIDHGQAIVLSSLIGMVVPHHPITRAEPALGALLGCLLLQTLSYLGAALVTFWLVPTLYGMLGISGVVADISVPLLGLGSFIGLREFMIRQLWATLLRQLNADTDEFKAVLRFKV
jgi:hypothetical protein